MSKRMPISRRASSKPRRVEIDGHQLTPALHARYKAALEEKSKLDIPEWRQRYLALDDAIHPHRPSTRASEVLGDIDWEVSQCSSTIHQLADWPWCMDLNREPGIQTKAGHRMLNEVAQTLEVLAGQVRAFTTALIEQRHTYVQDWARLDGKLQRARSKVTGSGGSED